MLNRRELLIALLGSQVASLTGCSRPSSSVQGEFLSPNIPVGHRIRDRVPERHSNDQGIEADVIIVGGGIAGLSAAWRLQQSGLDDFIILEMDDPVGGTAKSQNTGSFVYPWGAHYLPTPMANNQALIGLLDEMQVLESILADGSPVVREQYLCRDPEERVFYQGQWQKGLYPALDASEQDLLQLAEFQDEIHQWVGKRDDQGRRMFAIPMSQGSASDEVMMLDQLSMEDWMNQRGLTSPRLRWLVDYSCRDDFGLSLPQTSAWAGLFYFASRLIEPGSDSQAVITWPEGNGRIVHHLSKDLGDRLKPGHAVMGIRQMKNHVEVDVLNTGEDQWLMYRAKRLIFAAPQFLVPYMIDDLSDSRIASAKRFQYGSWVVANVHLDGRPEESGFPLCWDNVIYGSKSLGYVTSTHQSGIDHGPTVLTWYHPLTDIDPKLSRKQLLNLSWSDWADTVLTDLMVPHPDIQSMVKRLDVMRWGHAMIQPRPGFVSSQHRMNAAFPDGLIHFAGTDLSGVALMEEAFDHGLRSAEEVLKARGIRTPSIRSVQND